MKLSRSKRLKQIKRKPLKVGGAAQAAPFYMIKEAVKNKDGSIDLLVCSKGVETWQKFDNIEMANQFLIKHNKEENRI